MEQKVVAGVDLGGTNVRTARVKNLKIEKTFCREISAQADSDIILSEVIEAIDEILDSSISSIGIGVPGLVDLNNGIIYDMVNIPSWKKVHLRKILEKEYKIPVFINNDANCFALGESNFGTGRKYNNLVGIIIGTGLGAGIIIDNKIYNGANCGAGEFGMLPYLERNYEYYASGQFFQNFYQSNGAKVYEMANNMDADALKAFSEFGYHFGKVLAAVFCSLDPEIIVLGGSVSKAFPFFKEAMEESLFQVEYQNAVQKLQIKVSKDKHIPVLGAASLCFNKIS